jgi:hypothetical protein
VAQGKWVNVRTVGFRAPGSTTPFRDSTLLKQGLHNAWGNTDKRDRRDRTFVVNEEMANQQVQLSLGIQAANVEGQFKLNLFEVKPVSRLFCWQFLIHKVISPQTPLPP